MSSKNKVSSIPKVVKKTNLIIQLDESLKKDFQDLCRSQDMSCSQSIRKFMKAAVDVYKRDNLNVFRK